MDVWQYLIRIRNVFKQIKGHTDATLWWWMIVFNLFIFQLCWSNESEKWNSQKKIHHLDLAGGERISDNVKKVMTEDMRTFLFCFMMNNEGFSPLIIPVKYFTLLHGSISLVVCSRIGLIQRTQHTSNDFFPPYWVMLLLNKGSRLQFCYSLLCYAISGFGSLCESLWGWTWLYTPWLLMPFLNICSFKKQPLLQIYLLS